MKGAGGSGAQRFAVALLLAAALPAHASGIERLNQFMTGTLAATGQFEQRIYNRERKLVQESRGSLAFARPGKFRWTYSKPYAQLIVGDGTRVWVYDEDLNQVTVRKLDQALGSTPAALLAGATDALHAFELRDQGTKDGLEWVEAVPREKDASLDSHWSGRLPSGQPFTAGEDTLTDRIGKRIRSRLYEMCRTIEIVAPDYRKEIRQADRFRA